MESKEYSIIGKVEIGTDEYRDLVSGIVTAEKECAEYRSKFWATEKERDNAKKNLEEVTEKLSSITKFLNETGLMDKYKLWKIDNEVEE